jgi:hypothetical protein
MPLVNQLLVMGMLARVARPQLLQDRDLVPLVGGSRDALRMVHAETQRLAAFLADIKDSHNQGISFGLLRMA